MSSSPSPPSPPTNLRVAYLLADGGVPYLDSQKGASIHARSLVRAFEQEGCQVDVYTLRNGRRRMPGFPALQIPKSGLTRWHLEKVLDQGVFHKPFASKEARNRARKDWRPPNWMTALGVLLWQRDFRRCVLSECRVKNPSFLYARNAWLANAYVPLKRALGVPLALEVNAVCSIEKKVRKEIAFQGLTERIERRAFQEADIILPVTRELKEQVLSFCPVPPEKVVVTPNAVDLELFAPRETAAPRGPDHGFTIGCVHSFKAYHGMEVLLEAARRLRESIPGLKVRLVGGGEELERVKRQARQMGLAGVAEFTGVAPHSEVPNLLRDCDACVAPYVGEQNLYGCPMKLYEYMALKVPIVAAAWGDIPNTLAHGQTAYLHPIGDANSLAEYLLMTYRDPEAARRMAEAAYKLVEHHTWRSTARKILDWHAGRPVGDRILAPKPEMGAASPVSPPPPAPALAPSAVRFNEERIEADSDDAPVHGKSRPGFWNENRFCRAVYDLLLRAFCRLGAPGRGRRRNGRSPSPKPIRVLRVVSSVAQGGVAKVAVQSVLPMPESEVHTDYLVFGEKHKAPEALMGKSSLVINRRLELLPADYEWALFRHIFKLARIIKQNKPDLVHLHEPQFAPVVAISAALAGRIPVCVHMHSVYQARRGTVSRTQTRLECEALQRLPLIACSRTIVSGARLWLGKTAQPITLIEDGTDDAPADSAPEAVVSELVEATRGRIVVAKMARLVPLKRIGDFLQACRILLDEGYPLFVLLMCYGKDKHKVPIHGQFERWFAPHEGRLLYKVKSPSSILEHVDIGVSASSLEGLGLNILEYQIQGIPVVCSDIPAHREMVADGQTGLLFRSGDLSDLVQALKRALDDAALRDRIGKAGRQSARNRSWSDTAQRTIAFYHQILGR